MLTIVTDLPPVGKSLRHIAVKAGLPTHLLSPERMTDGALPPHTRLVILAHNAPLTPIRTPLPLVSFDLMPLLRSEYGDRITQAFTDSPLWSEAIRLALEHAYRILGEGPLTHGYLSLHPFRDKADYLGYPLSLTPAQKAVLMALLQSGDTPQSPSALSALCLPRQGDGGAIAVHVHGINKKAALLGGRKLIIHTEGGYRLNPFM